MGARKIQIINARLLILALILILKPTMSYAAGKDQVVNFDIPAKPLASALKDFARQSGLQVSLAASIVAGKNAPEIKGEHLPGDALSQLLSGSGLKWRYTDNGTILVEAPKSRTSILSDGSTELGTVFVQEKEDPREQIYDRSDGTSIIGRAEMDRVAPRHASEILQSTAGVFTATNEQNPSVSVNIRGLKDFGRVNMNIDGMRQNFQRSGHGQRNGEMFIDTEFLSEVDIQKGAIAGAGGTGVTGGVASFMTVNADEFMEPDERFGGRLRLSSGVGGLANGQEPSGSLLMAVRPTDTTDVMVGFSRKSSGEYQPGTQGDAIYWGQSGKFYSDADAGIVNATDQDSDSWLAKARWNPTESFGLKFTTIGMDTKYGESAATNTEMLYDVGAYNKYCNPPQGTWADTELCQNPPPTYDDENLYPVSNSNHTTTQSYALDSFYNPESDLIHAKAKVYYVTTKNVSTSTDEDGVDYVATNQTQTIGGILSNTSQFGWGESWFSFDYGAEIFKDENRPDADSQLYTGEELDDFAGTTPQGQRQMLGTWLKADWQYKRLTISPAIRWETYRIWGKTGLTTIDNRPGSPTYGKRLWQYADIDVDKSESKFLPSLGLAFDAIETSNAHLQLFANAGLSWRPPQITETLTSSAIPNHSPAVSTVPNWLLKPEETESWEAGFNFAYSGGLYKSFNLKLNQFYNRTKNYIDYLYQVSLPGDVETPNLSSPSAFANAINDRIYQGQELQLDFEYSYIYGALNVTHTEQSVSPDENDKDTLVYPVWVLGGPNGEDPSTYCPDANNHFEGGKCINAGNLYAPTVPEWTGRLTLGSKFMARKADIGFVLTCASQTGSYVYQSTDQPGSDDKIGLAPYCAVDNYGSYQWNKNLRFGYNLNNLTDRKYIQAMGDGVVRTYAPGRSLSANMQWDF